MIDLRDLLADRTRGASEIEERLLGRLLEELDRPARGDDGSVEALLTDLSVGIRDHQPSMANLLQLANRAWQAWEACQAQAEQVADERFAGGNSDPDERGTRAAVARLFHRRLEGLGSDRRALAGRLVMLARELWGPARSRLTVLTLSRSGSVLAGLEALLANGLSITAVVGEGRPGQEGAGLARDLGGRGAEVKLVTDAALVALTAGSGPPDALRVAPESSAVVVGADAMGPETWVNKVGTRPLAAAALERGIPVVVLSETVKMLPKVLFERLRLPTAPPEEIASPSETPVLNFYFERVPLSMATWVVSEESTSKPERMRSEFAGPVSERLLAILNR